MFRPAGFAAAREHSPRALLALACVASAVVGYLPSAAHARTTIWTEERVLAQLRTGPFVERSITIEGPLDFRPLKVVAHPFICIDCHFTDSLVASDTIFQRAFEVSGAQIFGPVRMDRASFRGPAAFGFPPGDRKTVFVDQADFTLASFAGLVTFEAATFVGPADFTLARFENDAIFAHGMFVSSASFPRTSFAAVADFRETQFQHRSRFEQAEFKSVADFSQARFGGEANFTRARFAARGTFFGANFTRVAKQGFSARFNHAAGANELDFASTKFAGRLGFRGAKAPAISFADADFFARRQAVLDEASAADFVMDVSTVDDAVQPEDRRHVLRLVEASAKSRNELTVANHAHYDLEVLTSNGYWWPWRVLDRVFYRWIAGYFVRPLRPLIALVALVAIFALLRALLPQGRRPAWRRLVAQRWRLRDLRAAAHRFVTEFLNGLAAVGRRSGGAPAPPLVQRLEVFTYRVLLVCALLGLANSNPTLRQMFDALV